jgi:ribosomal-protein-alanine acetyltransferase
MPDKDCLADPEKSFFIRPGRPDDAPGLTRLYEETIGGSWKYSSFLQDLGDASKCYLLAFLPDQFSVNETLQPVSSEGGVPAGFVSALIIPEDEAEILNVAVAKSYRRRGLARALLKRLITKLREKEIASVYLEVASQNEAAIRLYESCGFRLAGTRSAYYKNPCDDALIFVWRLRA